MTWPESSTLLNNYHAKLKSFYLKLYKTIDKCPQDNYLNQGFIGCNSMTTIS